jgi:hypothetical protein
MYPKWKLCSIAILFLNVQRPSLIFVQVFFRSQSDAVLQVDKAHTAAQTALPLKINTNLLAGLTSNWFSELGMLRAATVIIYDICV